MQVTSARNLQSAPDDNGMDFSFFFFFFFHYYYYFIFCFLFFFLFQFCVWASYLSATIGTSLERRAGAFSTSLHPPSSRVIYPPSFSSLSLSLSLSPNPTWCLYISRYPYERHRSLSVVSILGKNSTLLPLLHPPWNHQKWVNYLHFLPATRVPFFYHFIPHTAIYWLLRYNHWFQSLYGDRILRLR